MTQFFEGTEGIALDKIFGHNVAVTFERRQLLMLQFTKLVNYFTDQLVNEWGGHFLEEESTPAPEAMFRFLQFVESQGDKTWIDRPYRELPWGPSNCQLVNAPSDELGAPYEAYLSCGDGFVTINQASRLLCVEPAKLVESKLKLIYDELVILKAVEGMILPREAWPRIEAKQGGGGRSIRLSKPKPSNIDVKP